MDEVFRAINDPNRRLLLDALRDDDGQSLGQLCQHLPSMTRQGVMNHLGILETAEGSSYPESIRRMSSGSIDRGSTRRARAQDQDTGGS